MFRTRIGLPHLGLVLLGVLGWSCSPADDDSGRMPVVSAGAGGQSVPQAGANSVAGIAAPAAGRGALPGGAAGGGIGPVPAGGGAGAPGVAGTLGAAGMAGARGP
ncbi:MAG TPA: hypothetical protein VJV78_25940, partial [Polyangiales bacterium]|nr:hypothetical protein [Polyangiales bacterium]